MLGRVGEFEEAVERYLERRNIKLKICCCDVEISETHPRIIEAEAEERQLEVEVLMDLLVRRVNVCLQVALVLRTSLIKEPVHELSSDLLQTGGGNCKTSPIIAVRGRLAGSNSIHGI